MEFSTTEINKIINSSIGSDSTYKFIVANNPSPIIKGF